MDSAREFAAIFVLAMAFMLVATPVILFLSTGFSHPQKEKGHKVGRLKFKSRINSIPLKQYDVTYQLDRGRSMVKIQGLKKWLKVSGLRQIPYAVEIANANLVRKADDFYLKVTTFGEKKERVVPEANIVKTANQHPHQGDPRKMKVYDILREKYTGSFEKEIKQSIQFDYLGMAKAKTKWHEYLKSLGMTFDKKDGILDPSCHLEWQQRFIKISEDIMGKILTLGLP